MRVFVWLALAAGLACAQPLQVPVVLLNGWQFSCGSTENTVAASTGTFGRMAEFLQQDGAQVYFFNNCAYRTGGAVPTNEELAGHFSEFLRAIPAPEVDVVVHSMGGLIVRAYLAGQQANGAFAPPPNTRIRKFVSIATPHWGSFMASRVLTPQTNQMIPASAFLWSLNTWLRHGGDMQGQMRGVDALAIAGNGGYHLSQGRDDGVVSTLSAAIDARHTRIVPYCHITPSGFSILGMTCDRFRGIADIDNDAHVTLRIVRSFLADTPEWTTLGQAPGEDTFLRNSGGLYLAVGAAEGGLLTNLTGATLGSNALTMGGATGSVLYREFVEGTANVRATTATSTIECGSFVAGAGRYTARRCKPGVRIDDASPAVAGTNVTLTGQGFGTQCPNCSVDIIGGGPLAIVAWGATSITATLPANAVGSTVLRVNAADGTDQIRVLADPASPLAAPPMISSVLNGASFFAGIQSNSWVTIKGKNLATVTRAWDPARDFVGNRLPETLEGVSVTIDGRAAPVYFVSPTQLNVLAPTSSATGNVQVAVTNALGTDSFVAKLETAAPALFTFGAREGRYAAAVRLDGAYLGPPGLYGDALTTVPSRVGDVILLFGTGCGPTQTPVPTDVVFAGAAALAGSATVTIGGQNAAVSFAGMSGNGLCQFNVTVPALTSGDHAVRIAVGGRTSPPGAVFLFIE